jgi:outer membrane protein OmpA-like peptidoglycan-associated protein
MRKLILLFIVAIAGLQINAQAKTTEKTKATATKTEVAAPVKEAPKETVKETPKVSAPVVTSGSEVYAPQIKNPFEIGISAGLHMIRGDVYSKVGLNLDNSTFGIHVRKAFSYHFSMRLQYNYGNATLRHEMPHLTGGNTANNFSASTGGAFTGDLWFPMVQTYTHTLYWDNIFTIGNTSIHKAKTKFNFDLFAGGAMVAYRAKINLLDNAGVMHNFTLIKSNYDLAIASDPINGHIAAKERAGKNLDAIEGSYETAGSNNGVKVNLGGYALVPALTFGAGVNFRLSNKFNLGFEQRFAFVFDDYLDGERYIEISSVPSFTQNNDLMSNSTIKLNYNLSKTGDEPKYWKNENEYIYNKVAGMDGKKLLRDAFADEDRDGVPNQLDQEENSREGCPVDVKGVVLDSDKDGILDCDDKEPFSPAGYPIDNKGVAIVPPPACCQELKDNMKNMPAAAPVNTACAETSIPSIRYAKDKFGVSADNANALRTIGEKMQACPDMRLVIAGINDKNTNNGKYNEQLSYNRASEVVNHLTEKFGVSRDRFIIKYNQDGIGDLNADRAVMFRNAQTGEFGNSNPPSPHPGLKAGSKQ